MKPATHKQTATSEPADPAERTDIAPSPRQHRFNTLRRLARAAGIIARQRAAGPDDAVDDADDAALSSSSVEIAPGEAPADDTYAAYAQARIAHLRACAEAPVRPRCQQIRTLLAAHAACRGVVLCPIAYDASLKQRPDHLLDAFAQAGYLCVTLTFGGPHPTLRRRAPNRYVSNMAEDFVAYFQDTPVVLLLHWPGFKHFADLCRRAIVIYDALDRLGLDASRSEALRQDHEALLRDAHVSLFASEPQRDANRARTSNALVLENGASPADFRGGERDRCPVPAHLHTLARTHAILGYHGPLSELLDFDLLETLVQRDDIVLLFAGPVAVFDPQRLAEVQDRVARLAKFERFVHLGPQPYEALKHYLAWIDVGLVPFVVNDSTDPLLPQNVFEYLAADKPVIATPLQALQALGGDVTLVPGNHFAEQVVQRSRPRKPGSTPANQPFQYAWSQRYAPLGRHIDAKYLPVAQHAPSRRKARVDIVNVSFFDWHGETLYKGGAERYVYDLAKLLQDMDCDVRIVQNAHRPFERCFRGFPVVGVHGADGWDYQRMSDTYAQVCADADLVIASPADLAASLEKIRRVISINHGIHWDFSWNTLATYDRQRYEPLFRGIRNSDRCVCVDTNFINWLRTYDWGLANTLTYVPNYVDLDTFHPTGKDFGSAVLNVLLPRRLYQARGIYLVIDAFDILFERRADLRLTLCGQAAEQDIDAIDAFIARHPARVDRVEYDMEAMPDAYAASHVVLIPTLHSEGTSLSCLEALATNNAVIATHVGGLPNLIIDGYNGRLIQANDGELVAAIESLADDRSRLSTLAHNGLAVAQAFSKQHWDARWREIIDDVRLGLDLSSVPLVSTQEAAGTR